MMQFGLLSRVTKTARAFLSRVILDRRGPEVLGLYLERPLHNRSWVGAISGGRSRYSDLKEAPGNVYGI